MEIIELSGSIRSSKGKSEVKRLREEGLVPGVIYGKTFKQEAMLFQISRKELNQKVKFPIRRNQLYKMLLEGSAQKDTLVFLKDWQLNPLRNHWWEHLDLYAIDPKEKVKVLVPIKLVGKCKGVVDGGILQTIRREVTIAGLPMDIPDKIEVDVSQLSIGGSIHVNEVAPPEKCSIFATTNFAIAAVVAPEEEVVATPTPETVVAGEEGVEAAAGAEAVPAAEGAAEGGAEAKGKAELKKAEPKKAEEKKDKKEKK